MAANPTKALTPSLASLCRSCSERSTCGATHQASGGFCAPANKSDKRMADLQELLDELPKGLPSEPPSQGQAGTFVVEKSADTTTSFLEKPAGGLAAVFFIVFVALLLFLAHKIGIWAKRGDMPSDKKWWQYKPIDKRWKGTWGRREYAYVFWVGILTAAAFGTQDLHWALRMIVEGVVVFGEVCGVIWLVLTIKEFKKRKMPSSQPSNKL